MLTIKQQTSNGKEKVLNLTLHWRTQNKTSHQDFSKYASKNANYDSLSRSVIIPILDKWFLMPANNSKHPRVYANTYEYNYRVSIL